jgi:hypothetical protein
MSTEYKDIEILDAYMEGKLDEGAVRNVKERLQNDSEFASLYQYLITIPQGARPK